MPRAPIQSLRSRLLQQCGPALTARTTSTIPRTSLALTTFGASTGCAGQDQDRRQTMRGRVRHEQRIRWAAFGWTVPQFAGRSFDLARGRCRTPRANACERLLDPVGTRLELVALCGPAAQPDLQPPHRDSLVCQQAVVDAGIAVARCTGSVGVEAVGEAGGSASSAPSGTFLPHARRRCGPSKGGCRTAARRSGRPPVARATY